MSVVGINITSLQQYEANDEPDTPAECIRAPGLLLTTHMEPGILLATFTLLAFQVVTVVVFEIYFLTGPG